MKYTLPFILIAPILFSACEEKNNSNNNDSSEHSTTQTTISIAGFNDQPNYIENHQAQLEQIFNVSLNITDNNWGQHHSELTKNLYESSELLSDIFFIDAGMLPGYLENENLMNLAEKFEPIKNNFPSFAVSHGINELLEQKAVPFELGPGVAIYRRTLMEDIGEDITDVMSSWDSWLEYGRMLKNDHGIYLISNAGGVTRAMIYSGMESGTGVYFGDNDQILVESQRFKDAFQMAKTLKDEGLSAQTGMWNNTWYDGFNNSLFAMEFQGAWLLPSLANWIAEDTKGQWAVSHLPNGIYTSWGGTYLAINENSQHKDAAWEIIEYLIQPDTQLDIYQEIVTFPANTLIYSDDYFNQENDFLDNQKDRLILAEVVHNIKPAKHHRLNNVAETQVMNIALSKVLKDEATIDEALATAAAYLQTRLEQE